jgi:hypothetical protein
MIDTRSGRHLFLGKRLTVEFCLQHGHLRLDLAALALILPFFCFDRGATFGFPLPVRAFPAGRAPIPWAPRRRRDRRLKREAQFAENTDSRFCEMAFSFVCCDLVVAICWRRRSDDAHGRPKYQTDRIAE